MKRPSVLGLVAVAILLGAAVAALRVDRTKLARSVKLVTSLEVGQVVELLSGVGEVGVLAEGRLTSARTGALAASGDAPVGADVSPPASGIRLEDGTVVPLVVIPNGVPQRRPLPPLPMPDHPFLLDEHSSGGVHADSYNSSVSALPGPVGPAPRTVHRSVGGGEIAMCTPLMRDLAQRLSSICISLGGPSTLALFDPARELELVARTEIPARRGMLDPSGGWYTRMDHLGRPVVPTPAQDIRVFEVVEDADGGAPAWREAERYDLSGALPPDVSASDVVPSFSGDDWFISGFGHVGHLERATGRIRVIELGGGDETIGAALTVGPEGAYVLTSAALYMLSEPGPDDAAPVVRWRWAYGASGSVDLSTPTLFDRGRHLAFGLDGLAERALLFVVRTDPGELSDDEREVCRMPMFDAGASSLKNTVIGYDRSIVAQNNAGGAFFEVGDFEPGLARVDLLEDGSGCELVWEERTISSQVPPRLSTADGQIYQYARRRGTPDGLHAWYLTTVDFRTGKPTSERFVGSGKALDSPMLSTSFLPGGTAVTGVRGGLVAMTDGPTHVGPYGEPPGRSEEQP